MSTQAKYWVAKYVEDPIRNEPKNVGVIVRANGTWAARFAGERDDGTVDGRRLQNFKYADVYRQWLQYWREQIDAEDIDDILAATTSNYLVVPGGDVSDIGDDDAKSVSKFLYDLLVSDAPVMEAFELAIESEVERDLSLDLDKAFRAWEILGEQPTLSVRHPIRKKQQIRGSHTVYEPSFSQQNGKLYLFEAIDFNTQRPKLLRERAGFMAYMFSDIRHALIARGSGPQPCEAYSIIRPRTAGDAEAVDFARDVLSGESHIVNWADDEERQNFLRERKYVAEHIDPL
ncbi:MULTISPECIES: hypothetical protein [unclassified Bradyrhizobium]|uniref:hypothetical protein n=1 Tax=Bradyrhizobium sp. USDA 4541 TaxID=2817704 RepID=UPI0020A45D4E|nr:hypothetical protein [Bradyrhizobium sp. USDA 4541]MCP1851218.1 hypothetical protein [Bradyrhizobium sp. USDA 4541]